MLTSQRNRVLLKGLKGVRLLSFDLNGFFEIAGEILLPSDETVRWHFFFLFWSVHNIAECRLKVKKKCWENVKFSYCQSTRSLLFFLFILAIEILWLKANYILIIRVWKVLLHVWFDHLASFSLKFHSTIDDFLLNVLVRSRPFSPSRNFLNSYVAFLLLLFHFIIFHHSSVLISVHLFFYCYSGRKLKQHEINVWFRSITNKYAIQLFTGSRYEIFRFWGLNPSPSPTFDLG